jgi:hypothetical protein
MNNPLQPRAALAIAVAQAEDLIAPSDPGNSMRACQNHKKGGWPMLSAFFAGTSNSRCRMIAICQHRASFLP